MINEDNVNHETGEIIQLPLFEGHKIVTIEQKLKASLIGIQSVNPEELDAKLFTTRYWVIKATAIKSTHEKQEESRDVHKTITFGLEGSKEIDELTGSRLLAGL